MTKIARRNFLSSTVKMGALLPVIASPAKLFTGSDNEIAAMNIPDRIIMTVTQDPSTMVTLNWRTADIIQPCFAEYAIADAHPEFVANVTRVNATSRPFRIQEIRALNSRVTISGLSPDTLYTYRVGSEKAWSEWFEFRTAKSNATPAKLSFIYLGDAQVGIKPLWSRVIRKAYAAMPDAQLIIHAGDLVNRANEDHEWADWFAAGSYIHAGIPALMTPGNHEYTHEDGKPHLSLYWNEQFALPVNGPDDALLKGSTYYTDIQGVRIISLNTQMIEEAPSDDCVNKQVTWLHQVLQQNKQQWTCVVMHHPIYSTKKGRDNKRSRDYLKPVFEKYGVDLVLQGHDHAYARGMSKIALTDGTAGMHSGTTYVVSVSGSKMYETGPMDWADVIESHVQVYQTIEIDNNTLSFKAYLATGKLLDAFDLVKVKHKQNKLIDRR